MDLANNFTRVFLADQMYFLQKLKVPFLPWFWLLLLIALHRFVVYVSSLVLYICLGILLVYTSEA